MKAFVTGGTGFIGSYLIEFLQSKGYEIFALVRNLSKLKWLQDTNIQFLEGNLLSIPPLPSDIDTVFHVAGLTRASNKADYYTVNQQGTASLFQSLQSQKIVPKKVIHLSSIAAGSPSFDGKSVKESHHPQPVTPYGKSKLMGEMEAQKFKNDFPVIILRVSAVFGPKDRDFLDYFKFIKRGILPSLASKERLLSLCYIKDLIRAIYLCTKKEIPSGEIFNIADPNPYSWDEFGIRIGQTMGKKIRKVKIPPLILYLAALTSEIKGKLSKSPDVFDRNKFREMMQRGWVVDVNKAAEKLSFQTQYSLEEAIEETVDWYVRHDWL